MKNLITLSKINVQILGSYAWIYLYLIPAFYLKEYRKCFTSLFACIAFTIIMFGAALAIIMFAFCFKTVGVHYAM